MIQNSVSVCNIIKENPRSQGNNPLYKTPNKVYPQYLKISPQPLVVTFYMSARLMIMIIFPLNIAVQASLAWLKRTSPDGAGVAETHLEIWGGNLGQNLGQKLGTDGRTDRQGCL